MMNINTVSSREFNQDISRIKQASSKGPVFVTNRGHATHVLMTIEEYYKITGKTENIVDLLAMPDDTDINFNPPKLKGKLIKTVDLS